MIQTCYSLNEQRHKCSLNDCQTIDGMHRRVALSLMHVQHKRIAELRVFKSQRINSIVKDWLIATNHEGANAEHSYLEFQHMLYLGMPSHVVLG